MDEKLIPDDLVRFGVFEVDLVSGELRKSGVRLRLGGQPFQLLAFLLRNPGKLVEREELKQELWADDTFVDFENGVNTAIRKIRRVLDDSADTPRYVETLPRRGYRFIGPVEGRPQNATLSPHPPSPVAPWKAWLPWALLVVMALAWMVTSQVSRPPETGAALNRFSFTPQADLRVRGSVGAVAVSPNGRHIAFAATDEEGKLWVQDLDGREPRVIASIEGAQGPFWSPDSSFIGFVAGGELKRVPAQGGPAAALCDLPNGDFSGGSWSPDGEVIVFGSRGSLYELPARGGAPTLLIQRSDAEGSTHLYHSPHFLPTEAGRRVLLFTRWIMGAQIRMMLQELESGRQTLLGPGYWPFYSPSGHLVYQSDRITYDLWALPFSLSELKSTGEAFPIAQNGLTPSVAADGTLVYLDSSSLRRRQLVWLDRGGNKTAEIGPVQSGLRDPELSPDGRLVGASVDGAGQDIWVYDTARGSGTLVSASSENEFSLLWSPEEEYVAFTSYRRGNPDIFLRRADGAGNEEALVATPRNETATDWSRDGKYLVFDRNRERQQDIWYLERREGGGSWEEKLFLQTPAVEGFAKLSPDGRYLAYVSDLSGQYEVYVRPFPDAEGGRRVTVSSNGGGQPRWSDDGKELFYVEGDTLLAVSVTAAPNFSLGAVNTVFKHPTLRRTNRYPYPQYDVSADGQRFILAEQAGEPPKTTIRIVQNWFAEFRDRERD